MKFQNKESIISLVVFIFISMAILVTQALILFRVEPKIITKEITKECPVQTSFTDTVYLLNEKDIEKLPFCGLIYGGNEEGVFYTDSSYSIRAHACFNWAGWDKYDGITIINLDRKK